jgi:hypothetical protein
VLVVLGNQFVVKLGVAQKWDESPCARRRLGDCGVYPKKLSTSPMHAPEFHSQLTLKIIR